MATKTQIGINWGNNAIYLVQTIDNQPNKITKVPLPISKNFDDPQGNEVPDGMKLTSILQKTFIEQSISSRTINLSLPVKDIFFRSFIIPWMNPSEIKNVVDFEAGKYTPFDLKTLVYAHHPLTFLDENKKKRVRILFVAIKRVLLTYYCNVLEHSGLKINSIEPAPISLVRLLLLKKKISKSQTLAIVNTTKQEGQIIVVDKGVVQMVREFQILPQSTSETNSFLRKYLNEIRITMEYFSRQFSQKINSIITLSDLFVADLKTEFKLPLVHVSQASILENIPESDIGFLNAYGTAIKGEKPTSAEFNLPWQEPKKPSEPEIFVEKPMNYASIALTAVICCLIVIATMYFSNRSIKAINQKITLAKNKLERYENFELSAIESQHTQLQERLLSYKGVPQKTKIHEILSYLSELLPPTGAWLHNVSVNYERIKDPNDNFFTFRPNLIFDGYVYLEDPNQQIRLVNQFVNSLRNNKNFNAFFGNIALSTVRAEELKNEFKSTYFRIECK